MASAGYDVVMMWNDNRKSRPSRTCRVSVSILVVGVTLLAAATHGSGRRRGAAATSSVASRESVLELHVLEEFYPRAEVGDIIKDYRLDRRYLPSVVEQLRFGFLTHSSPAGGH